MLIDSHHIDILARLGVNLESCHLVKIADKKKKTEAQPAQSQMKVGEKNLRENVISRDVGQTAAGQNKESPKELKKPSPQYKCDSCSRSFHRNGNLLHHMNKKHKKKTTRNRYNCNACHGSFASKLNLKLHESRKHSKGRLHKSEKSTQKCESCDKSFSTKGNLKMHTIRKRCPYETENLSKSKEHKKGALKGRPCKDASGLPEMIGELRKNAKTEKFEDSIANEMESSTRIEFDDSDDETSIEITDGELCLKSAEKLNNESYILPAIEFDDSDSD